MLKYMMILALLVSGCAQGIPTNGDALCQQTRAERTALAADAAVTEDDRVAVSAARLIDKLDAGCNS